MCSHKQEYMFENKLTHNGTVNLVESQVSAFCVTFEKFDIRSFLLIVINYLPILANYTSPDRIAEYSELLEPFL